MDIQQISQLVGIPVGVGSAFLIIWLWLGRRIRLTEDVREEMERLALIHKDRENSLIARIEGLSTDRDLWRVAYQEEVEARKTSERTAADLLGSANITSQLLSALMSQLNQPRSSLPVQSQPPTNAA